MLDQVEKEIPCLGATGQSLDFPQDHDPPVRHERGGGEDGGEVLQADLGASQRVEVEVAGVRVQVPFHQGPAFLFFSELVITKEIEDTTPILFGEAHGVSFLQLSFQAESLTPQSRRSLVSPPIRDRGVFEKNFVGASPDRILILGFGEE